MKRKKLTVFILAMIGLTLALTACGEPKESSLTAPGSSGTDRTFGSTTEDNSSESLSETENLLASQEYVSADGVYRITLPEGLTQTETAFSPGTFMMELSGEGERAGFSCIVQASYKESILGNPEEDIESLEEYADYTTSLFLDGSGITVSWEDTDAPPAVGVERCIARKGNAQSGLSRGMAYACFAESADSYLTVFTVANTDDVEEVMQVIALEVSDEAAGRSGTVAFFNGMTAVLDSVNGANLREAVKMLADNGAEEEAIELYASAAKSVLSSSWGIENAASLADVADLLINEGHNQEALELLQRYGGLDAADRDAFAASLEEQNLDEETQIYLLAAYDAWAAYGDGAIAAWDLSRVGTIMSFGYAAGYCTYEEAMDKILEAAEKAQQLYGSWEDFNRSYLYGYSYWAEESLEDPDSSAAERAELVHSMEAQANGPFSVDWNTELKKEW